MKNRFIEYHINDHVESIFNEAAIVLDTNSLLNLYRYSKDTRTKYLEILSFVEERLHLTHHVCHEFYKNRQNLINNRSVFKSVLGELLDEYHGKFLNVINCSSGSSRFNAALGILKHEEFLKSEIKKEIEKSINNIQNHIDHFEEEIDFKYLKGDDPILTAVVKIFQNKISPEFTIDEINKIYKDGEERFRNHIPPGYKDKDKPVPEKYGDLVIWNELQILSKNQQKDILLVSDDRKEDWIIDFRGMDLGPRKELIKEFYMNTGKLFYSITTKDFIKLISEKYSVKDTESLQKETEIIQNKIKEDSIFQEISNEEWKTQHELFRNSLHDPEDNWNLQEEMLNPSFVSPLEELKRTKDILSSARNNSIKDLLRKEIIRNSSHSPIEELNIQNEIFKKSVNDPFKEWTKQNELQRNALNNPIDEWRRANEFLQYAASNPLRELKTRNDLLRELIRKYNKKSDNISELYLNTTVNSNEFSKIQDNILNINQESSDINSINQSKATIRKKK